MSNVILHNTPPRTVGIDVDNVIVKSDGAIQEYAKENGIYLTEDDYRALSLGVRSTHFAPDGIQSSERVDDFLDNHYVNFANDLELMPGVVEAIAEIRKKGHQAVIVTARGSNVYPNAEDSTEDYMTKNRVSYDKILFGSHNKAATCLEHGIEILVDDSLSTCIKVSEAGLRAVLFTSRINADSEFTPRLDNWLDKTNVIETIFA